MRAIRKSIFIIVLMFLCSSVWAYDYPWYVDYKIIDLSLDDINFKIENYIKEHPQLTVYELDWEKFNKMNPEPGDRNQYYKISLEKRNYPPFEQVLCGEVFLCDVNSVVNFIVPSIKGNGENYIRLISYCKTLEIKESDIISGCPGAYISFNDVEPTKTETEIKESFEKNFLDKLYINYEYQKPSLLDSFLSKFLSLFRKRKNFID